jgi:hypothetical protein
MRVSMESPECGASEKAIFVAIFKPEMMHVAYLTLI